MGALGMLGDGAMFECLLKTRFVQKQIRRSARKRVKKLIQTSASAEEIFRLIYKTNFWGNPESVSGDGSTLAYTNLFRTEFEQLLYAKEIMTLFDAPCGDFNWMKHVRFPRGMKYIGADIVSELIKTLNDTYLNDGIRTFVVIDVINDDHPKSDLWLCRHCLFHFSFADILRTLELFVASGTNYCLLTTTNRVSHNIDIKTGLHRDINLLEEPFRFPRPEFVLSDPSVRDSGRSLGLWRNEDVAEVVRRMRV
jgi:hypothetical protein